MKKNNDHYHLDWLEAELNNIGVFRFNHTEGVYFCEKNEFVAIIFVDYCCNASFLQSGFLSTVPNLLIVNQPTYSNSTTFEIIHISELEDGVRSIEKEIDKCIAYFHENESTQCRPFDCVVPGMPKNCQHLILCRTDSTIYINEFEIINKRAKTQFDLFNILMDAFIDDVRNGTITYMNIYQIADKLIECGHKISDPEKNVRQSIKNIKFPLNQK